MGRSYGSIKCSSVFSPFIISKCRVISICSMCALMRVSVSFQELSSSACCSRFCLAAMDSYDIRGWIYFTRFQGMYDRTTENAMSRLRSQRSRSPRVFPRLNAEPLAEPIDVNSESSYWDSDVDSMGDGLGFPPEIPPRASTTARARSGIASGTTSGTASGPSMPSVFFSGPVTFNGPVTFVSAVNFSSAHSGGMSAASSSAQRIDQSPPL